jgi:hypothetical protein
MEFLSVYQGLTNFIFNKKKNLTEVLIHTKINNMEECKVKKKKDRFMMINNSVLQVLKRGFFTLFFFGVLLLEIQAQEPIVSPPDTLNVYEQLIKDLEDRGISVVQVIENEELIEKMKSFDINTDSLRYYYNLKSVSEGKDTITVDNGRLILLGRSYGDSIVLRWAPSKIDVWDQTKQSGYTLFRMTQMDQNGEEGLLPQVDPFSRVILADSIKPILPWTLEHIGERIQATDTMAIIAAQAMYGSAFSTSMDIESLDFVERHKERLLRFGFSLLMADRSALAAEVMGLRFVDTTVEIDKKYVYGVYPVGEESGLGNITFIDNDPASFKKVEDIEVLEGDGEINLFWPRNKNTFSGYWIERSDDNGVSWQKMTSEPVVFIEQDDNQGPTNGSLNTERRDSKYNANTHYLYTDKVDNFIKYDYRVSGQTPFADYSNYGFTTGTAGDLTPPPIPQIVTNEVDQETGIASLAWKMDGAPESLTDLAGFSIWEAPRPDSVFVQISAVLPPETRSYVSPAPLEKNRSHYYLLKAVDENGNQTSSYPLYMHIVDDAPPLPPLDPAYLIDDSTGVVTLVWKANEELDLAGYRIYFANNPKSEFSQLTKEPIHQNLFQDTIALVTLSEKIYYKIQAVDLSYNRSEFSEILTVKRPDYVPPVQPVLVLPEIKNEQVTIRWEPSSSADVEKQLIYRRLAAKDQDWQLISVLDNPWVTIFRDSSAMEDQLYEYTMRVQDDAGLFSEYAFPIKVRKTFDRSILQVQNLQAVYNPAIKFVQLSWQFDRPDHELLNDQSYLFYIYRSTDDSSVARYRVHDNQTPVFIDEKITVDGQYSYAVKVIFANKKSSDLSESVSVKVKLE